MYTIYSKPNCPQCDQAKSLLTQYSEIIIDIGQEKLLDKQYITVGELKSLVPNAKSVPQIFKDGVLIGGLQELRALLK